MDVVEVVRLAMSDDLEYLGELLQAVVPRGS
jgi:hypothetical protein